MTFFALSLMNETSPRICPCCPATGRWNRSQKPWPGSKRLNISAGSGDEGSRGMTRTMGAKRAVISWRMTNPSIRRDVCSSCRGAKSSCRAAGTPLAPAILDCHYIRNNREMQARRRYVRHRTPPRALPEDLPSMKRTCCLDWPHCNTPCKGRQLR